MIRIENRCVECGIDEGCMGDACPNRRVEVHYCDRCDEELALGEVYEVDEEELCEECLKERFKKTW